MVAVHQPMSSLAVACGWIPNCIPMCILDGCSNCLPTPNPTGSSPANVGTATATSIPAAVAVCVADTTLSLAAKYCRQQYALNAGCVYDATTKVCKVPVTVAASVSACIAAFGNTSPPPAPTSPPCVGANHPCACNINNGCGLLGVDPGKTGNAIYTCFDVNDAVAKSATILNYDPSIPNTVLSATPSVCTGAQANSLAASGAVGGAVSASSTGASAAAGFGSSVSVTDVEKNYMYCVANTLPSTSNLRKCITSIVSANVGAATDPKSTAVDFSTTLNLYVACPSGVSLSQSDFDNDACHCMVPAMNQVASVNFNGVCSNVLAPSSGSSKRFVQQASGGMTSMTMNTQTQGSSSSASLLIWEFAVLVAGVLLLVL